MTEAVKQDLDMDISHMKVLKDWLGDSLTQKAFKKSIDIAIECMEELEQYRALGAVEELKKKIKTELPYMSIAQARFKSELDDYRNLGTVEELKEAMEKQIPKKPKIQRTDDKALFKCPCCDNVLLEEFYGVVTLRHGHIPKHCENCGQAIREEGGTSD